MSAHLARRRQLLALAGGLLPWRADAATAGNVMRRALDQGVLRVGVWLDAPPWGGFDADGRPDGSEVATARLLARDMNLRLQLVRLKQEERVTALLEDRCDVVAAALPMVASTISRVAFTVPYGRVTTVFAAPSELRLNSVSDLVGKRVAISTDTAGFEIAHDRVPPGGTTLFMPRLADAMEALLLGVADVAVTYDWQLRDLRLARPDLDIMPRLMVQDWSHGLAAALGQPDLLRLLNVFTLMRGIDGSLEDIHARYFSAPLPDMMRFR